MAKSRKTARKTSSKRSSSKRSSPKASAARRATRPTAGRGVNLKKIREDLVRAIAAMKKSPAALEARAAFDSNSDQAQLEEMVEESWRRLATKSMLKERDASGAKAGRR